MLHFKNHQGKCACNRNLKNVAMSDTWQDLKHNGCKNCKKTEQYLMAKQESPIDHPVFRQALKDKIDMKLDIFYTSLFLLM